MTVSFSVPTRGCSWAIIGGGLTDLQQVVWLEVSNAELRPDVSPQVYVQNRMRRSGIKDAAVMLTSRRVASYCDRTQKQGDTPARCIATVGLGNALRAGDPPGVPCRVGTINLLVYVDKPLSDEALLEASAIATEAKVAAVMEAGVKSRCSGLTATGTGTDCIVISAPLPRPRENGEPYAGKHTEVGAAIGEVVYTTIEQGIRDWIVENRS